MFLVLDSALVHIRYSRVDYIACFDFALTIAKI